MLSFQSVIGCRLTFEKLLRAELRGGLRAKLLRDGAVRAASQITAGRAADYDVAKFAVRAECGPSYCGAGCGLNCNLRGGLRAQMSSPRRTLMCVRACVQHDI